MLTSDLVLNKSYIFFKVPNDFHLCFYLSIDGMKCSLLMNFNELKHIVSICLTTKNIGNLAKCNKMLSNLLIIKEINYKPTPRHNNYTYKSKEDSNWILYQVFTA